MSETSSDYHMKSLDVIIPCYNEEAVIESAYIRLKKVLESIENPSSITFINDGSKDNTLSILRSIAEQDKQVRIINFSRNFGHQPAVTAGLNNCTSDLALIIDADLQDPPELIPDILRTCEEEKAQVVYCVRKRREGEGWFKKLSAKLFYRLLNRLSDVPFPTDTGDFRLIDAAVIREFNSLKERGKYIRGLVSWIGFKQVPFYYERHARFAGETKYPAKKMLKFASTALTYFSKKPLLMAMGLGFISMFIGILLTLWYIFGKFFGYTNAESGFTSIMIITIFFGGVQLMTIGVLGQYMGVLFDEVKERPEYIVEEKINF